MPTTSSMRRALPTRWFSGARWTSRSGKESVGGARSVRPRRSCRSSSGEPFRRAEAARDFGCGVLFGCGASSFLMSLRAGWTDAACRKSRNGAESLLLTVKRWSLSPTTKCLRGWRATGLSICRLQRKKGEVSWTPLLLGTATRVRARSRNCFISCGPTREK